MDTAALEERVRHVRQKLLDRGAELRDRIDRVRRDLRREREPLPRDSDDAAIVVENDEVLQAIEESATCELQRIQAALARLEEGVFTLCETCGAEIDAERLRVVPYATECRACARDG
ncbi:MAG TPA: TraR/DksA family transcriptional regulator [Steroidobacteraceae bacterium]|nr:TraR/DksA family transcriptional regulator [Steroidobacteraceae bacterium]